MTPGPRRVAHWARTSTPTALGLAAVSAYVVLAVLVTTARTRGVDASVYEFFRPAGVWGRSQRVSADLVDGLGPAVVFSALGVAGVWTSVRGHSWRPLAMVGASFAVTAVVTVVSKLLVHREDTGGALVGAAGSFPSGHAASITVCLCGVLMLVRARIRPWEWGVLLLLAMVATVPILVVGLHWLTDVVGGILLGLSVSVPLVGLRVHGSGVPGAAERTAPGPTAQTVASGKRT
jgi:membrane-associated phospholipid phosphatase